MIGLARFVYRQLHGSAGFAVTAITILAIGIGATTAMYSVLDAVLLRPLPFPQPDRLVAVSSQHWRWVSLPTVEDWERRTPAFQSVAAVGNWAPRIESSAGTGRANTILVSQNFLRTLGIGLVLGHDLAQSGNEQDCNDEALVSAGYWQRMGGGQSLAGKSLRLDGRNFAIVGVLSPSTAMEDFDALNSPSIFTAIGCDPRKQPGSRGDSPFQAIGRLRPGVSLASAKAEIATAQAALSHDYPTAYPSGFTPDVIPLSDFMAGTGTRASLIAAAAACGLLLLISCANLTNLFLARNTRRRPEFALRATLGATSRHLLLQMLAENCSLTVAGTCAGLAVAFFLVRYVRHLPMLHLPRLAQSEINLPAVAFAALATLLVAILLTILPAARILRLDLLADLSRGASRSTSASSGLRRAGRVLVASQIAMAVVLVACAGWMVSSVVILLRQPLGFDPEHLVIASTSLRIPGVADTPARTLATMNEALTELRALPGVLDVAASNDKPLGGRVNRYSFCSDARPDDCKAPEVDAPDVFLITPSYFKTVGQRLYRGREFNAADDGRSHVAIVNRALAERQWPGQDPIGHRIYSGDLHAWATVIGETADVHSYSLESTPVPNLYIPEADTPDASMTFMLRTHGDPTLMDEIVRHTLRRHSSISVRYVESMPELMEHQVALRRFSMWIATILGCLAVVLATIGTYGLLAYEVSLREREIGLRLALGSSRPAVVSLLLRRESRWILVGIFSGLAGAIAAGYILRASFFHTGAASLPVLTAASLLIAIPALMAVAIPGHRASFIDPAVTLRRE